MRKDALWAVPLLIGVVVLAYVVLALLSGDAGMLGWLHGKAANQ